MDPAEAVSLAVEVAWSPRAGELRVVALRLPAGATVHQALRESGVLDAGSGMDLGSCKVGVWGHLKALGDALRDQDRVEVWRGLRVDPKEARRQRYRQRDGQRPSR